jgi:hypothetical protein
VDEKSLFKKRKLLLDGLSKLFFKLKNALQNISANLFASGVFHKNIIFNVLLMRI